MDGTVAREVALHKLIRHPGLKLQDFVKLANIRRTSAERHPNVVKLLDVIQTHGQPAPEAALADIAERRKKQLAQFPPI